MDDRDIAGDPIDAHAEMRATVSHQATKGS
jgi:hypothetical protein